MAGYEKLCLMMMMMMMMVLAWFNRIEKVLVLCFDRQLTILREIQKSVDVKSDPSISQNFKKKTALM
jgi:hypothetical protein